jgi:thiosulfate dehydrogenase [quinone] large subunit
MTFAGIPLRRCGYALLRATLGVVFFLYGVGKFLGGPAQFAAGLEKSFSQSFLPGSLVYAFGLVLPYLEVLTGLLLVFGIFTWLGAILAGLLLLPLTAGATIGGQSATVSGNLVFAVCVFLLLHHHEENALALDTLMRKP